MEFNRPIVFDNSGGNRIAPIPDGLRSQHLPYCQQCHRNSGFKSYDTGTQLLRLPALAKSDAESVRSDSKEMIPTTYNHRDCAQMRRIVISYRLNEHVMQRQEYDEDTDMNVIIAIEHLFRKANGQRGSSGIRGSRNAGDGSPNATSATFQDDASNRARR